MNSPLLFSVLILFAAGGVLSFALGKDEKKASAAGEASCALALGAALVDTVLSCLLTGETDRLFYRLPIVITGFAAALHAPGYLDGHSNGRTGFFWLFFQLTLGSMYAVTTFDGFLPFLIAWELMGLFSFFLVAFDRESKQAMRAAWIYLLACEAGGMLLMTACAFSLRESVSAGTLFVLLFLGFGLKAGFPFLHVWLPEAHPAAPAPVSAVMSGAMIPLGFCGLLRFQPELPEMYGVYGWTLLAAGLAGSFFGILSGIVRRDLKRLLAYSSVENIGIIAVGFGLGFLGAAKGIPAMSVCGFTGAYLHILNHALLKGILFLGAGSVFKSAHTLNVDLAGGLMKKMPLTGGCFTLAAAGLSGLPPFCGFTGEILIYSAGFLGIAKGSGGILFASFTAVIVLALAGGAAFTAFAKAVSSVFLGLPRSDHAIHAEKEEFRMVLPLLIPLVCSFLVPFAAPFLPGLDSFAAGILRGNAVFTLGFGGILLILCVVRQRSVKDGRILGTWDCGFAKPSARMEYTGTAFVQPVADFFNGFLRQKKQIQKFEGLFPPKGAIDIETTDFAERVFWKPLFLLFAEVAERIHRFQSGYLHLYILIMTLALAAMLLAGFAPELLNPNGGK